MTERNRETLKNYFSAGKLPSSEHFVDLVDSMLNMKDEGFRKSPKHGLELASRVGNDALLSFFKDRSAEPQWSVAQGGDGQQLIIQAGNAQDGRSRTPLLTLDRSAGLGVLQRDPQHALHVQGTVASSARVGCLPLFKAIDDKGQPMPPRADGEWHDLLVDLQGCQAFEVVAVAGQSGGGRFAILYALAMNAYNPTAGWLDFFSRKKRIHTRHAWYGRRCDQLQLRWEGTSGKDARYKLRIRTGCCYGDDPQSAPLLQVSVTSLLPTAVAAAPEAAGSGGADASGAGARA